MHYSRHDTHSPYEQNDVIVVGGGQAGLATSYLLKQNGIDHIVFDKGDVGDTWRHKRWDSFCLVTQNRQCRLPGFHYDGDDPHGFMSKDSIVDYLVRYAESFKPALKSRVNVNKVSYDDSKSQFVLDTTIGTYYSNKVIIATGTYQHNRIPTFADKLTTDVKQLHSSEYKNANSLLDGGVLVVGSGQSGCQIIEDLVHEGRKTYLCVGKAGRISRTYRGKDILQWADLLGMYETSVENHPEGKSIRFKAHPHITGRNGGRTINLRKLALDGVTLYGRLADMEGNTLFFDDDLKESLHNADNADAKIRKTIDEFIEKSGIDAPEDNSEHPNWEPHQHVTKIDLLKEQISTIIWATGYKYDFSWIEVPVFDERGYPIYDRGVTDMDGLYFVGLHWLHTWGSGLFYGVGEDAEYIVNHISSN